MLAPEDVAWADSCLSKDPDMLDSGWISLKSALFDAFDAQNDPSPYGKEDAVESDNMDFVFDENRGDYLDNAEKTVSYIEAAGEGGESSLSFKFQSSRLLKKPVLGEVHLMEGRDHIHNSETTPISMADSSDGAEVKDDGGSLNHEDAFWSKHKKEEIFLPTYDESLKDLGLSDLEVDFTFEEFKLEQSTDDIFKIWDFDIPAEENDLTNQLHKALAGNPSEEPEAPPFPDDSEAWKEVQNSSVDDLISGIADLTLSPYSDQHELT